MHRRIIGFVALACFAIPIRAQIVVVDPNGGGQYRDLQTAIDAVAPGTTLRVLGGTYPELKIGKSLTILCEPRATITQPYTGSGTQPPAITLAGSGSDRLTLSGLTIRNFVNGASWNSAGEAIRGSGFSELFVAHSELFGAEWRILTGDAIGARALHLAGVRRVWITDCTVQGAASVLDNFGNFGPDGPSGIEAQGADVVVQRTAIRGGDGGMSEFNFAPSPVPCPCQGTGRGGSGIVAARVFQSGATITGGAGGEVRVGDRSSSNWRPWGRQPDGAPIVATLNRLLPTLPAQTSRLRIGQVWQLTMGYYLGGGVVLIATPAATPLLIMGQWVLVEPATLVSIPFASSQQTFTAMVPNLTSLIGTPIAVQVLDNFAGVLSGPALDVIDF
jgi:hypothetical protein